jgi:hypothetical protein
MNAVRMSHVFILMLGVRIAAAVDAKKDSVTVLPWTQASLAFTEGDKSAAVEYTQLFAGHWMLYGKASAPLDSDTRIAAFTRNNKLANGFSGSFQFGHDGRAAQLRELERNVSLAIEGADALRSGRIGQQIRFEEVVDFENRHPEAKDKLTSSSDFKQYICNTVTTCPDHEVARAIQGGCDPDQAATRTSLR